MDPLRALAELIVGWHQTSKLQGWLRLGFQMGVSAVVTFLTVTGSVLMGSGSWPVSIGTGMVSTAVSLAYFVRRSPLTNGMLFVFPNKEAKDELNQDLQVLQR